MPRIHLTPVVALLLLGAVMAPGRALSSLADTTTESQGPRFSAGAALVTVDVVVLDESGEPIEGLRIDDFKGYFAPTSVPETPDDEGEGLDPNLRAALDSPFDADAIPLRMVSYVLGTVDGKTTVLLVADVDPRGLGFQERDGRFEDTLSFHLVVSHRDSGERVHRGHEVELSPGRHQARLLVRDRGSGQLGTVRHDLQVPAPDAFRVSTPILTDVVVPASDEDSSLRRPRPLARRTFVSGGMLTLAYEVHGAEARSGALPTW